MPTDVVFTSLLEKYVFSVADQFIGSATPEEQACLLALFALIHTSAQADGTSDTLAN